MFSAQEQVNHEAIQHQETLSPPDILTQAPTDILTQVAGIGLVPQPTSTADIAHKQPVRIESQSIEMDKNSENAKQNEAEEIIINIQLPSEVEIHSDQDRITVVNKDETLDAYDTCCMKVKLLKPLLYLGPLTVGANEAAQIAQSLFIIKSPKTPLPIVFIGAISAFFSSIGLTLETTKENLNETCKILKRRGLPKHSTEWPPLSPTKEKIAICLSIEPALWGCFSEAAQGFYFVNTLTSEYKLNVNTLGWAMFSGVVAVGVGLTNTLTYMEMYKEFRKLMAGVREPYRNKFSQVVSPIIGGSLGVLKAFQDSVQSYIAIKSIFGIEGMHGKILIGVPSFIDGVPKFCFEGRFSINAIDEFFGYLPKKEFSPKKFVALSFAAALAIYLSFLKRPLNKLFYQDVIQDFEFDPHAVPDNVYDILSWVMFVEEAINNTASLYLPMYHLVDKTTKRVNSFFSSIYHYCCPPSSPTPHEEEEQARLLLNVDINNDMPTQNDTKNENEGVEQMTTDTDQENLPISPSINTAIANKKEEEEHDVAVAADNLLTTQTLPKPSETRISNHPSTLYGGTNNLGKSPKKENNSQHFACGIMNLST